MPAYEYQCIDCRCHFERRQKMSDPAIESCPECGGAVKRLISGGAGAITKGGGHSAHSHGEQPACALGGPCCGQGGCGGGRCFEQ